jgi:hypothetical protein
MKLFLGHISSIVELFPGPPVICYWLDKYPASVCVLKAPQVVLLIDGRTFWRWCLVEHSFF